jgi:hypothetical protein
MSFKYIKLLTISISIFALSSLNISKATTEAIPPSEISLSNEIRQITNYLEKLTKLTGAGIINSAGLNAQLLSALTQLIGETLKQILEGVTNLIAYFSKCGLTIVQTPDGTYVLTTKTSLEKGAKLEKNPAENIAPDSIKDFEGALKKDYGDTNKKAS